MAKQPTTAPTAATPQNLFREAMHDVRPLARIRTAPPKPKPAAQARFRRADDQAVLIESLELPADPAVLEAVDELMFHRPEYSPDILRKLRTGAFAVDAELDLHGHNGAQAKAALREFIATALARRHRCVRVIHGKGHRSGPRGPVLKNVVNVVLRRIAAVAAFASARPIDGGVGAVYVLLKTK